jgi:hypothetical protein
VRVVNRMCESILEAALALDEAQAAAVRESIAEATVAARQAGLPMRWLAVDGDELGSAALHAAADQMKRDLAARLAPALRPEQRATLGLVIADLIDDGEDDDESEDD